MIRMPFGMRRSDSALAAVVERSAQRAGIGSFQMATIMTHFLEELAAVVATGEVVTIPGFGQFAPVLWQPKDPEQSAMVLPRFQAARAFKNEVASCCLNAKAQNVKASAYRRRHATHVARAMTAERVFTAMRASRERLSAEARRTYAEVSLQRTC